MSKKRYIYLSDVSSNAKENIGRVQRCDAVVRGGHITLGNINRIFSGVMNGRRDYFVTRTVLDPRCKR